ncbi:MAG: imidazole glycerol phosphate synthase subunit HisH [Holosporales bacterium]|jgi:glutamine amidotransferase|nr:imidazole glycerol phosphate synthase subunit HisH [Holosporales bacterium]
MSTQATLVDYGLGNMLSVHRMLEHCGAKVNIAALPDDIISAERLVFPGVGAFASGMQELAKRGMIGALREFARGGRPILGICLGMQLFMSIGEEFGEHVGINIIPGRVKQIPSVNNLRNSVKIPHIGWNAIVNEQNKESWDNGILKGIQPGEFVYFAHSFYVDLRDKQLCIAQCVYENTSIPAVVRLNNIHGCQFHPEKSGPVGIKIIKNFLTLA